MMLIQTTTTQVSVEIRMMMGVMIAIQESLILATTEQIQMETGFVIRKMTILMAMGR